MNSLATALSRAEEVSDIAMVDADDAGNKSVDEDIEKDEAAGSGSVCNAADRAADASE